MDKAAIVKLVDGALQKYTNPKLGTELMIDLNTLTHDKFDDWWYVRVKPVSELKRIYDFYDVLAQAEEELQSNGQNIKLIPA